MRFVISCSICGRAVQKRISGRKFNKYKYKCRDCWILYHKDKDTISNTPNKPLNTH